MNPKMKKIKKNPKQYYTNFLLFLWNLRFKCDGI